MKINLRTRIALFLFFRCFHHHCLMEEVYGLRMTRMIRRSAILSSIRENRWSLPFGSAIVMLIAIFSCLRTMLSLRGVIISWTVDPASHVSTWRSDSICVSLMDVPFTLWAWYTVFNRWFCCTHSSLLVHCFVKVFGCIQIGTAFILSTAIYVYFWSILSMRLLVHKLRIIQINFGIYISIIYEPSITLSLMIYRSQFRCFFLHVF